MRYIADVIAHRTGTRKHPLCVKLRAAALEMEKWQKEHRDQTLDVR